MGKGYIESIKTLLFKSSKTPKILQSDKQKQAIDYVDQLLKCYNKESDSTENNIGSRIGSNKNALELYLLKAKLITGQQYITDELLAELEKLLWMKV